MAKRFDHFVLMGMRIGEFNKDDITYMKRWGGNSHTCAGLASDLLHEILENLQERTTIVGEGEDHGEG